MISSSLAGQLPIWTGRMGVALAKSNRPTFTRLATEGIVGNTVIEPLLYMGEMSDHQDTNIYNSFVSIAGGSLGFAAGIKGLSVASEYLTRFGDMAVETSLRTNTGRLMAGKMDNTGKYVEMLADEAHNGGATANKTAITSNSGARKIDMNHKSTDMTPTSNIQLNPASIASRVKQNRWYIPHRFKGQTAIEELNSINPGRMLGKGITLTDNPVTANGYSAHSTLKTPGSVYEVDPNITQITQMDHQTIAPRTENRKGAARRMEEVGFNKTEIQKVLKDNPTYQEALDRILDLARAGRLNICKH